jgi:ribonuclease HI
MRSNPPRYVLTTEAFTDGPQPRWRFELLDDEGQQALSAEDTEPGARRDRLELLAVVRGLEALEQASSVAVQSTSAYVRRGITEGLDEWRSNGWTWERFGEQVPVQNQDLWQRLDRALAIHHVHCRQWRIDPAHVVPSPVARGASRPLVARMLSRLGAGLDRLVHPADRTTAAAS